MSLDLRYYSFDQKKADEGWKHFAEDVLPVREINQLKAKRYSKIEQKSKVIHEEYEKKLRQKRQEIFDSFTKDRVFFSGMKSWAYEGSPEEPHYEYLKERHENELLRALQSWKLVYPEGLETPSEQNEWRRLNSEDMQELESLEREKVQKLSEARQEVENSLQDEIEKIQLTDRQKALAEEAQFLWEASISKEELESGLRFIDLYYGEEASVGCFEDNKIIPFFFEEFLAEYFRLDVENGKNLESDLVNVYERMSTVEIEKMRNVLVEKHNFDPENALEIIQEFFREMKPIVKTFKENPDSLLVMTYGGDDRAYPKKSETILKERQKEHEKEFKEILRRLK